jgi:ribosomal protein L7Ae-like RNA K-turn-binding protein
VRINGLTAYALNSDIIKSVDAALEITGSDSLKRQPVTYALAVGSNETAKRITTFDMQLLMLKHSAGNCERNSTNKNASSG